MKLYEHNGLLVRDGKNASPGNVVIEITAEIPDTDEEFPAIKVLTERQALELANALTHGKLETLLNAIDHAASGQGLREFSRWSQVIAARKVLP